jgi:2-dehydropantoate 2-reductase
VSSSSILLIGPGAIGGAVSAWLVEAGHEVTLAARTAFETLRVETPDGRVLESRPRVITDPAEVSGYHDWVLVATKTYDSDAAAEWLGALGDSSAPVAVLQNGVEHVARFSQWLPRERILPVMVDIPCERDAPGKVRQRGAGMIRVPAGETGRAFVDLFDGTSFDVSEAEDFTTVLWRKLCINVAGAVSALADEPGGVAWREPAADAMRALVRECIAVGRAEGATLDDSVADQVVEHYRKAPPDSINSLHADRLAHRPMEWEARNGAVRRAGRKHGIATPVSDTVCDLLAAIDQRNLERKD